MQLAYNFNFAPRFPILLLILWIFGLCMLTMGGLVYLPVRWLLAGSLLIIALHNCLDNVRAARFGSLAWAWMLIHQPGVFTVANRQVLVTYTLLPWIAVMSAGFCFGQIFDLDVAKRRRVTFRIGIGLSAAFFVLRAINLYGDPEPWSTQKSPLFSALSFLNCTKYPASLDFLLMTLGPALLFLAYLERRTFTITNPLVVFGRVPLFYFVLHFYAIHSLVFLLAWVRYGTPALKFMTNPLPSMGGPRQLFPADFGYNLPVIYLLWILIVASLYPLCLWFAKVKSTRTDWWLSYI